MKILLGYEVGTGEEVFLEDGHTTVTGMTQLSGKTTCLEALVERGKVRTVAFLTKRGESGFRNQREIPPYFKEQKKGNLIDWQYVSAILEAVMSEKMRLERSFIINACKGAHSLQEVYENIKGMRETTRRGFDESIYTNLAAYFEIILPQIEKYNFAESLRLKKGFNVLNLIEMADEMQQLVIESVLSYVMEKEKDTVVVIPEAHKFIPQGRNTPVKATALKFIREGAAIRNFMWIDTQETTSVDKAILKQCSNWIMGYQQEKNEVANVRENIGRRKISEEDIMNLKLGHFVASLKQVIYHVYVLPAGIESEVGKAVATGKLRVEEVKDSLTAKSSNSRGPGEFHFEKIKAPTADADQTILKLNTEVTEISRKMLKQEEEYEKKIADLKKEVWATKELVDSMKINHREDIKELEWERDNLTQDLENERKGYKELKERMQELETFEGALMNFLVPRFQEWLSRTDIIRQETVEEIIDRKLAALTKKRKIPLNMTTGIAWVDIWINKLGPAEQKILHYMAAKFPLKMTKSEIAIGIGLTSSGGYFTSAFNKLKKNKLIESVDDKNFKLAEGPP